MKKNVLIDVSNILYRTFFAHLKDNSENINFAMCHHMALTAMNKYYKKVQADQVVMAFDNGSWRKLYTKDLTECHTYKRYKGYRRQGLTKKELERFEKFDSQVAEFMSIMKENTGVLVLEKRWLEADDLIAGFIQNNPDDKHYIISADKDYIQLMRNSNVVVIDPITDKNRDLSEWDFDADYFMFEKCIRGDVSDNVISSYPRVRSNKIKEAYSDDFARTNFMNHVYDVEYLDEVTGDLKTKNYKTEDVFLENKLLMDLTAQPDHIKDMINQALEDCDKNRGKFDYFLFLKYCGRTGLDNIAKSINNFTSLLSGQKTLNI